MSRLNCCWIASAVSILTLSTTTVAKADTTVQEPDKAGLGVAEVDNPASSKVETAPTTPIVVKQEVASPQPDAPSLAPPPREKALPSPNQPIGLAPLETGPTAMKGKWNPVFYGFLSLDMVHDSTQSFSGGSPGYVSIARPGTYAASHGRTVFDPRGSRFGFKLAAPEMDGMKATAVIEADFLGNQLPMNYGANATGISENATYNNGLVRLRHAAIKIESRYVDILAGQYWQLFGWMPIYLPVTLQVAGYPGVPFGRNAQFRVSHTFKTTPVNVELAIAAVRPGQRNGSYPDAHGGARLMINGLRGISSVGATGATFLEMPAGLAVSGIYRHLNVPEFAAAPTKANSATAGGVSVDMFVPIIPSSMASKGNALNITGNVTYGRGIGDMYSPGTIGNAGFPNLLNTNGTTPAPVYTQDIDNGIVTYDQAGGLHTIQWETGMAGIQYYLPPSGRVWLTANYGFAKSTNIASYDLAPDKIITKYTMWDGVIYVNVVGPVTFGGEFAQEKQTFADAKVAKNNRIMVSGFYQFW
jgi:hypothetical protein